MCNTLNITSENIVDFTTYFSFTETLKFVNIFNLAKGWSHYRAVISPTLYGLAPRVHVHFNLLYFYTMPKAEGRNCCRIYDGLAIE